MPYFDWLALIKDFFKKKPALNQTVFYGIRVKYFLPLTFLFLVGFPSKLSQLLHRKGFNNSQNIFVLS